MSWFGGWLGGGGGSSGEGVGEAFSAGDIIRQARRRHPAFSEQTIPSPVALSLISTVQADLHQLAQQRDPFYVVATYVHLLTTWRPTVTLPAHAGVSGGLVRFTDESQGTALLSVVSRPARLRAPRRFCAVLVNQQLTLVGDADWWRDVKQVDVDYAPVVTALTSEADGLILPASAWSAVIASLELGMGQRAAALGISGVEISAMAAEASQARGIWLDTVRGVGKARPLRIGGRVA